MVVVTIDLHVGMRHDVKRHGKRYTLKNRVYRLPPAESSSFKAIAHHVIGSQKRAVVTDSNPLKCLMFVTDFNVIEQADVADVITRAKKMC